ncbi:MAG TPA: RNA polymerase sigma factor [Lysobacter sp.]|nr:RNA polymerase sigma factor [Lysobacter sp.]
MPLRSAPAASTSLSGQTRDSGEVWGAWMVSAQDGDRDAYHALLVGITPYLRAITQRYLGRCDDAEDAVQEILLVVHDIRHTYERGRPFKPWLSTIATRRCIDLLRRRSRRSEHEVASDDDFDLLQETAPTPDEAAARLHESQSVREAVAGLSPKQQEAIRLVHLGEMSLGEASAQSRQSVGSLKVACHRALKTLKQALGNKGQDHD